MPKSKVSVDLPKDLYDEVKKYLETRSHEFNSVEKYIEFVLREVLREEEPEQVYTHEEGEKIKARLRALGYL